MESGINADQNFYVRRPLPQSPERHQLHHQQQPHRTYDLRDPQARSPDLPPKLPFLTAANLQAATSNGYTGGSGGLSGGDPDAFYREYRGVQSSNGVYNYSHDAVNSMAALANDLGGARPLPSIRNARGTTPKPAPVAGARQNLKPAFRSASAPINNDRPAKAASPVNDNPGRVNVKDMLKRFDQNNEHASTARKPAPKIVTKESSTGGASYMRDRVGYQVRPTGNNQTTSSSRAGAVTRDAGPSRVKSPSLSKGTQRTRFATEDQYSNNTLSGVPRTTRLRNAVSGNNSQASKSMTNLSPTSSPQTAASQLPARRPLFGEVLPEGLTVPDIGYGISHTASRRTSDSGLHTSWGHMRSKSNIDTSPSSPTAWYLGGADLEDVDPNKPRTSPGHNRNHSDFADAKVNTMNGVNPSFQQPTPPARTSSAQPVQPHPEPAKSSSRLPVSQFRKPPSDASSPTSTRSSSPFTSKPQSNGKLRKQEQRPWSPAGRSSTPTSRTMTPTHRTTTPVHQSPRSKTQSLDKANQNKSSLNAYVSSPPPKNSPPLRSSRPRQPVSSATTSSSRQEAAERNGSPQKVRTGMKLTRNGGVDEHRPRKIADGPVDFAERRLTIQRAYTNRIQEQEQREIRAANMRRLQERQARDAAEKERAKAEAQSNPEEPAILEPPTMPSPAKPLHISTSFSKPNRAPTIGAGDGPAADEDSPTLGIPGSFVDDDDAPASAISNATGVTDIDNEPQTEAAHKRSMVTRPMSSVFIEWNQLSPEQASFGMDHSFVNGDSGTIEMILDNSPAEDVLQESTPTPTKELFTQNPPSPRDPSPPGAFKRDSEYGRPTCATIVTTTSPSKATPVPSRSATPAHSKEALVYANGDGSQMPGGYILDSGSLQVHPPPQIALDTEYDQVNTSSPIHPSSMLAEHLAAPSLAMNDVHDYLNTPVTDMDYDSSDGYGGTNMSDGEADEHSADQHRETRGSFRMFRASHQSAWTDYSVDTGDDSSEQGEYHHQPMSNTEHRNSGSLLPDQSPRVLSKPDGYSPQPSPLLISDNTPRIASPVRHQLPPLSTGEGFGFAFPDRSSRLSGMISQWPDHSPPPPPPPPDPQDEASPTPPTRYPPPPSLYNRRPPSSIYQSSQNGTSQNNVSRRASDDVYSPRPSISTPRSSTQISLEEVTPSQSIDLKDEFTTEEEKKAAEKTKKKLHHRRMIIKELIDTESVYLKDMNVVEEIYKGTAEACPKLDTNDVRTIFRNSHEIVAFSTVFIEELKSAGSSVYSPRSNRSRQSKAVISAISLAAEDRFSIAATLADESDEQKDLKTFIGANFGKHLTKMQTVFTDFLKNQEAASDRLTALQADPAVKVWLTECNAVAKDLTAAWDLDALLVKPVQRITRYQLLLTQILENTPDTHPDHKALQTTCGELSNMIFSINELKGRLKMVGAIVGRKRKESDVRSGLAKAFGRRGDKPQLNVNRPHDDDVYVKLHEKYSEDFVRLQVVLRDVEFYTRQCATYVNDFLRYLSAIELIMRLSPSPYPELESKWARFNMSMRDMGTVALDRHVAGVKRCVIEPIEKVIQAYAPPALAMKKRNKRRLDYEKSLALKGQGKKINKELTELVSQYEALNETLKLELPKLSQMTVAIGKICQSQFVSLQVEWYQIWQDKVKVVLETSQMAHDIPDILDMFNRDYKYQEAVAQNLGIVNGTFLAMESKTRGSVSTSNDAASSKSIIGRPSNISSRSRGLSITSDRSPSLPTPDFAKRHSGQFAFSPIGVTSACAPQFAFQNQPYTNGHSRTGSGSPATPDLTFGSGSRQHVASTARPGTSRSFTSDSGRVSTDYNNQHRRESSSTFNSGHHVDGPLQSQLLQSSRPYSGLFHSAMPLPDGPEESQRSSRASSRDRNMSHGYNVLYLAASLFEFNISAIKKEAGYPYLTYQAGEIFDVIGEKGELWLAKNQDDPPDNIEVGWIWSKHFARLATD